MLSNHNQSQSSFRIIEPKRFQHAQDDSRHMPVQQMPNFWFPNNSNASNLSSQNANLSMMNNTNSNYEFVNRNFHNNNSSLGSGYFFQQQQNQQQFNIAQQQNQNQQPRLRNLSDTDSSYVPGMKSSIF